MRFYLGEPQLDCHRRQVLEIIAEREREKNDTEK